MDFDNLRHLTKFSRNEKRVEIWALLQAQRSQGGKERRGRLKGGAAGTEFGEVLVVLRSAWGKCFGGIPRVPRAKAARTGSRAIPSPRDAGNDVGALNETEKCTYCLMQSVFASRSWIAVHSDSVELAVLPHRLEENVLGVYPGLHAQKKRAPPGAIVFRPLGGLGYGRFHRLGDPATRWWAERNRKIPAPASESNHA